MAPPAKLRTLASFLTKQANPNLLPSVETNIEVEGEGSTPATIPAVATRLGRLRFKRTKSLVVLLITVDKGTPLIKMGAVLGSACGSGADLLPAVLVRVKKAKVEAAKGILNRRGLGSEAAEK